jgi:hypothetical protein
MRRRQRSGGTGGSNPVPSSGESTANLTSGASIDDRRGFTESVTLGLFLGVSYAARAGRGAGS